MHLRSQKQLQNLELLVDNASAHHQTQIDELKVEMHELITKNQELKAQNELIIGFIKQTTVRNNIQFRLALRYLHTEIYNIIPIHEVPLEISRPLTRNDPEVQDAQDPSQPPRFDIFFCNF